MAKKLNPDGCDMLNSNGQPVLFCTGNTRVDKFAFGPSILPLKTLAKESFPPGIGDVGPLKKYRPGAIGVANTETIGHDRRKFIKPIPEIKPSTDERI